MYGWQGRGAKGGGGGLLCHVDPWLAYCVCMCVCACDHPPNTTVAYDIFDGLWPNYACELVFELYEVAGDDGSSSSLSHAVRTIYNGEVKHVPGCSSVLCDIAEFQALSQAIIPTAEVGGARGGSRWRPTMLGRAVIGFVVVVFVP